MYSAACIINSPLGSSAGTNQETISVPNRKNMTINIAEQIAPTRCPRLPYSRERSFLFFPRFIPTKADVPTPNPSPRQKESVSILIHMVFVEMEGVPSSLTIKAVRKKPILKNICSIAAFLLTLAWSLRMSFRITKHSFNLIYNTDFYHKIPSISTSGRKPRYL